MLPGQQKADEVRRGDGLDLLSQPVQGVAVDPRQEPAVAPFGVTIAGGKAPPKDKTFGL